MVTRYDAISSRWSSHFGVKMVPLPYLIANNGIIPVGFSDHGASFGVRKLHRII